MSMGPRAVAATWWTACALQAVALWLTIPRFLPTLGIPTWHHNATLAASLLFGAVFWRRLTTDRRWLGVGVMVTTILAVASGFLLLYLKQDLKDAGYKDWAKWWHIAWSWFALVLFAGHTWVNRKGLARSMRRVAKGAMGFARYWLPHILVLAAIPLTWSHWGASRLQDPQYIPLTLYTWLVVLVPVYGLWLWATWRKRQAAAPAWAGRPATQAFVDSWLFPMTILANVSGFPILWLGTKDTVLKYVAKYWHTWPSILMAVLVFAHTVQFWASMRKHLRVGPKAIPSSAPSE
jgi:hypothetical protein